MSAGRLPPPLLPDLLRGAFRGAGPSVVILNTRHLEKRVRWTVQPRRSIVGRDYQAGWFFGITSWRTATSRSSKPGAPLFVVSIRLVSRSSATNEVVDELTPCSPSSNVNVTDPSTLTSSPVACKSALET